jgi:hypothetical protein
MTLLTQEAHLESISVAVGRGSILSLMRIVLSMEGYMKQLPACETCQLNPAMAVLALPFGPYSAATCKECYEESAFPLWTLDYLFNDVGNGNDANLIEDAKKFKSHKDGHYIDWEDVKKLVRKQPNGRLES